MKQLMAVAAIVLAGASGAFAADRTWTGKISDSKCGVTHAAGEHGKKMTEKACTEACVKSGGEYILSSNGKVYKLPIPPLVTSNSFAAGHRIRIEVSSSAFPHFERNLNTGGNNFDEKDGLVARNVVHHAPAYLSRIVLPVAKSP
jgi:predicted acyl esterase